MARSVVPQGGRAHLAHERRRVGLVVPVHGVLRRARRGREHPRVVLGSGRHQSVSFRDGGHEVRHDAPATRSRSVRAARAPARPQPLPAAVLDLDAGARRPRAGRKRMSTSAASARSRSDVPQVRSPALGGSHTVTSPQSCSTPSGSARRSARRPRPGGPRASACPRHGVVARPPRADPRRPHVEGVLDRARHVEGHAQRGGHRRRLRFGVLGHQPEPRRGVAPDALEIGLHGAHPLLLRGGRSGGSLGPARSPCPASFNSRRWREHRGPADGHGGRDLLDGLVPAAQQAEDLASVGVAQRLERVTRCTPLRHPRETPGTPPTGPDRFSSVTERLP